MVGFLGLNVTNFLLCMLLMSDSLFQLRDIFSLEVVLLQLYPNDLLSLLHIEDFVQVLMPIIV